MKMIIFDILSMIVGLSVNFVVVFITKDEPYYSVNFAIQIFCLFTYVPTLINFSKLK